MGMAQPLQRSGKRELVPCENIIRRGKGFTLHTPFGLYSCPKTLLSALRICVFRPVFANHGVKSLAQNRTNIRTNRRQFLGCFPRRNSLIFNKVRAVSCCFSVSDNLSDGAQHCGGLAPRAGIEPATSGLGIQHSVQLSYRGKTNARILRHAPVAWQVAMRARSRGEFSKHWKRKVLFFPLPSHRKSKKGWTGWLKSSTRRV